MRIAKRLDDLPVGTPIECVGSRLYKGLVCEKGCRAEKEYIRILYDDGQDVIYYEEELEEEQIMIVEIK